jgi:hypothetical protein
MAKTAIEQLAALEQRHAEDAVKIAELKASIKAAALVANLAEGDIVTYPFGRGETRKTYTGKVAWVGDTDKGKKVKVLVGEGADLDVHVIDIGAITAVGEEVQEADAPNAAAASADPLASIE